MPVADTDDPADTLKSWIWKNKAPAVVFGVVNIFVEVSLMVKFSWIWILSIGVLISGCASDPAERR